MPGARVSGTIAPWRHPPQRMVSYRRMRARRIVTVRDGVVVAE
jgi:hypothetical protein